MNLRNRPSNTNSPNPARKGTPATKWPPHAKWARPAGQNQPAVLAKNSRIASETSSTCVSKAKCPVSRN